MKFYVTFDNDGNYIPRNADFIGFNTEKDARKYLTESYSKSCGWDESYKGVDITEDYTFGDAWIINYDKPRVGESHYAPFSYTQLNIQKPSEHPCGNAYLITPNVNILIGIPIYE